MKKIDGEKDREKSPLTKKKNDFENNWIVVFKKNVTQKEKQYFTEF